MNLFHNEMKVSDMEVAIINASLNDRALIENLLQLYIYDFTEFTNAAITENGLYKIMPDFDTYWTHSRSNVPYLINVDEEIAGFILIKKLDEPRKMNYLSHFFILRKFRRKGVGRKAAVHIFKLFGGEWGLHHLENNVPAQKFWDRIIDEISAGESKASTLNGRRYLNFVQYHI